MHSSDDGDQDFFNTFSESLPGFAAFLVVALILSLAYSCGLTIAKAVLGPFVRMTKWRPARSSTQSSDDLSLLPFGSQRPHAPGSGIRKGAAFSGEAEEPATMRRAA
jgi:hypothetical protein